MLDKLIIHFDQALRTTAGSVGQTKRISPGNKVKNPALSPEDREISAGLMRVNHCGEVCAQALYHGQALTAKSSRVAKSMKQAADEETDHLSWCEIRLKELDSHVSYLNPIWYTSSFLMGAATGLMGDKINLGFVAAVEDGVCQHIDEHLERLPSEDERSRLILSKMREDEAKHMDTALEAGGAAFPAPLKSAMMLISKLMTRTTYWV